MNAIQGIVSSSLKNSANWFLYIFIDENANLPTEIMDKRKNQLWWLHFIADVDIWYSFQNLVSFVEQGITERYGMPPNEVLQKIYDIAKSATTTSVHGVGDTPTALTTPTVTVPVTGGTTLEQQTAAATAKLELLTKNPTTGTTKTTNIWTDIASVIEWIVKLISAIGGKKTPNYATTTATAADWAKINNTSTSSIGDYIPYVVGAAIVYTLITSTPKKGSKSKQK